MITSLCQSTHIAFRNMHGLPVVTAANISDQITAILFVSKYVRYQLHI